MSLVSAVHERSERIRFVRGVEPRPSSAASALLGPHLKFAGSLEEVLHDPAVDAVVLATPHSLHREQVLRCAEAGKPVFCEKPLALAAADAQAMILGCRQRDVVLGVGHNRRFWPSIVELKRLARSGELGELLHIEGHNSNENSDAVLEGWRTSPDESPGGGLTGAGLHVLDVFTALLGPVARVQAQMVERAPGPPPRDTVAAIYRFMNGMSGVLATVRATPFYWRIHLFGANGSAEVTGENEVVVRKSGSAALHVRLPGVDSLRAELEAFADAVEHGTPFPVSGEEMLATVRAFEGTVRALRTGEAVCLSLQHRGR